MSMFAIIVAGRLVQTDFQRVGESQFLINIADAASINHIVVFMTGTEPFPEGVGGSVYFSWPDPLSPPSWQLLGHLSNVKPSTIFKLSKLKRGESNSHPFGVQQISHVAQIGILVEPLAHIAAQTPLDTTAPSNVDSFTEFTTKMLQNFFNYASSFAAQINPLSPEVYVPLNCLQQWFINFERRLQQNPTFWKN